MLRVLLMSAVALFASPSIEVMAEDRVSSALGSRLFPTISSISRSSLPASITSMLADRDRKMAACAQDASCRISVSKWTEDQIALLSKESSSSSSSRKEVAEAVRRELAGLNAILDVYGEGSPPRYAAIDGPHGAKGSDRLQDDLDIALMMSHLDRDEPYAALDRSIGLAVSLIDANDRLDAIAFEPISAGLNAAAFARASGVLWGRFPYSSIIVLGSGPDDLSMPLSARGKLRLKAAARRYFGGDAPFVIVSGGAVHPRGTRTVEAVEMRRALIERFGVPADAVIIEPYARHTTTNLRNASRLLFSLHAPEEMDALIVSSPEQIDTVEGEDFADRNQSELGYQPGKIGKRVSPFAIAFRPSLESMRVDPSDPLDP